MSRFLANAAATLLCLVSLGPLQAGAVEFQLLSSHPSEIPAPGTLITIELAMTHSRPDPVHGLAVSIRGYDAASEFVSGEAVGSFFNSVCVAPGSCFGGLVNEAGSPDGSRRTLVESDTGFGPRVQLAQAFSISPAGNVPGVDHGLDGTVGSAMFRVVFRVLPGPRGPVEFFIDAEYPGDGVVVSGGVLTGADGIHLVLIPEPGTALLVGFGLAGLVVRRRTWGRVAIGGPRSGDDDRLPES